VLLILFPSFFFLSLFLTRAIEDREDEEEHDAGAKRVITKVRPLPGRGVLELGLVWFLSLSWSRGPALRSHTGAEVLDSGCCGRFSLLFFLLGSKVDL